MLTQSEITAGTNRLSSNKLTASDQETLVSVFRLLLKNRFSAFSDLSAKLAALVDSNESKTAAKLAGILILLEENGFDLSELRSGRSGLQTDGVGEMALKIRFGLTLLGYDLPDEFSGGVISGAENINSGAIIPSVVVNTRPSW